MLPLSSLCSGSGIKINVVAELGSLLGLCRRERFRVELATKSDVTGSTVVPAGGTVSSTTIAPIPQMIIDPASEIGSSGLRGTYAAPLGQFLINPIQVERSGLTTVSGIDGTVSPTHGCRQGIYA